MSIAKKIANANWEDAAALTTRHAGRHGLSPGQRKHKDIVNRMGKKFEKELAFKDAQDSEIDFSEF
jgi:hypothetical protein